MVSCSRECRRTACSAVVLGCLLGSVSLAQQVRVSHAPGVDFSKYRTYRWVEVKVQHPDPSTDAQIKRSIDSQLMAKGLRKTNEETADLDIDYQTAISETQKWQSYEDWSDTTFGGQRLANYKQVTIEVGTLVVDMYDPAPKRLVWTGRAHKTLNPDSSQAERQKNIDKAAKQLFADFPPKL